MHIDTPKYIMIYVFMHLVDKMVIFFLLACYSG